MTTRILYLFTRTPLHVGAGASVGAIDQPIIRERHTGLPVIPATSLKGTFADEWNNQNGDGNLVRGRDGEWLFGSTDANNAFAGALQFSEARLLAFPIRSARGSFAWITCPLMLQRAARDGAIASESLTGLLEPKDEEAVFPVGNLDLDVSKEGMPLKQIVLEEYTFTRTGDLPNGLGDGFGRLLPTDPVWQEVRNRLVILSNGMMSFFARNACEVAQHVRIDDETGTAAGGALFNQENVPSEAMFYSVLYAFDDRSAGKAKDQRRKAAEALDSFKQKVGAGKVFQFGGDASTGLGYCTLEISDVEGA